jgi:hypothetical protein
MKKLFFAGCALAVCMGLIYHFAPKVGNVVTTVPVDGAGYPLTYAFFIGLALVVLFWRMQAKS